MSLIREYTDVSGKKRVAKHIKQVDGLVGYRVATHDYGFGPVERNVVYSTAALWELEDGSVVQIPDDAWFHFNIDHEDTVILEKKK